jgi:hypothetical protein
VRYQVLGPVFIDGSLVEPAKAGGETYVFAEPGLEGRALKLAPVRQRNDPATPEDGGAGKDLATPKDGGADKGGGGSGSH